MIKPLLEGRYAFLILIALVTCFWWPALWYGKVILHGDSAYHGFPLLWLHSQALAGKEALLWSSRIYGGHPIFAEGQGGFANPLNILIVYLFESMRAQGFLHWATLVVGGAGVFSLCRILGITRWSATFAAIAVVFSGSWTFNQHDYPVVSTLAWMPWLLAAGEYWLLRPSPRRAAIMAFPSALLVFGGYPQVTHGALLYLLASLLVRLLFPEWRVLLRLQWRSLLLSGLLAILLATGLAAIQFLPLLELVGESFRSQGTAVFAQELFDPAYLHGLLYFYLGDSGQAYTTSLSSGVVVGLAGLVGFLRMPARIVGQLFGALLLFSFGMGMSSPLFQVIYEHHLIPGLHYFRLSYPYFTVAVIGVCVAAAYTLDALSGDLSPVVRTIFLRKKPLLRVVAAIYGIGIIFLCYRCYLPEYSALNFLAPLLVPGAFFLLAPLDRRRWFSLLAVLILCIEVLVLRVPAFKFYDKEAIRLPQNLRPIVAAVDRQDYKVMDLSLAILMATLAPKDPAIEPDYRRLLNAMTPFAMAFQWQTPSINGVSGLHLSRRDLLDPLFGAEILGGDSNAPGLRLIDILGIRYISRDTPGTRPGLSLFAVDNPQDPYQHMFIYRNDFAKPRFQVYWSAQVVDTPVQALAGLKVAQSEKLFIERHRGEHLVLPAACTDCAVNKPAIEVIEAQAMRYRVNVNMPREGWLFLADANYPGWESTVNGKVQPVYSAQVLGKAVRLQAGRNEVTIRYVPWSFY
ncbi:MAG TPA: hypothetical protein PLI90_08375, partial [Rhodocyclaceae bacterium]|nr:hypothetical protein [Rhodocyclaceae bacterium]